MIPPMKSFSFTDVDRFICYTPNLFRHLPLFFISPTSASMLTLIFKDIIHGDVKCENVLIFEEPRKYDKQDKNSKMISELELLVLMLW